MLQEKDATFKIDHKTKRSVSVAIKKKYPDFLAFFKRSS